MLASDKGGISALRLSKQINVSWMIEGRKTRGNVNGTSKAKHRYWLQLRIEASALSSLPYNKFQVSAGKQYRSMAPFGMNLCQLPEWHPGCR